MFILLGQAVGDAGASNAALAAFLLNVGFSGIVAWWLMTKAIPKNQVEFKESLKEQRVDLLETLRSQRVDFAAALKEQRADFTDDRRKEQEALTRVVTLLTDDRNERLTHLVERSEKVAIILDRIVVALDRVETEIRTMRGDAKNK